MDSQGLSSINPHYLDRIMDLADDATIEASEDIFSANGVKLLAKGAQISRASQERLIRHKLAKPFETSVILRKSIERDWLQIQVRELIDLPLFAAALGETRWQTVWPVLETLDIRQPGLDLLLALISKTSSSTLRHATLTAMFAVHLGHELGLRSTNLDELALAGLLHDIGLLYLDPATLTGNTQNISVLGWRQLGAHSLIGGMALRQIPGIPRAVIQATEEHHERFDGSGYPKSLKGQGLSPAGIIMGAANLLAELLITNPVLGPVQAAQALSLLIGEFPKELMNHGLTMTARCRKVEATSIPQDNPLAPLFMRIGQLQMGLNKLEENRMFSALDTRQWLERMRRRLIAVQKLFSSTGIDQLAQTMGDSALEDQSLQLEIAATALEIQRRLRELGEIGILQMVNLPPPAQECASPWLRLFLD